MATELLTVAEAAARDLTWDALQSRRWRRISSGVYARSAARATPLLLLAGAWRRMPAAAAFSGRTAGWLHGLDLPPCDPIEVTVPAGHAVSHRAGVHLRKVRLEEAEVVLRQGFRVTSALRTVADLGMMRGVTEAVVALDMAVQAGLVSLGELALLPGVMAGRKGVERLRRAVALADVAESPMETRLRLLLVLAGLPPPVPQVSIHRADGGLIGRTDLFYESHRLCIEFDGGHHRHALVEDNRRQNQLIDAGCTLLRFTASDLIDQPERVIAMVRAALARRPPPDFAQNPAPSGPRMPDFARNQARGRQ